MTPIEEFADGNGLPPRILPRNQSSQLFSTPGLDLTLPLDRRRQPAEHFDVDELLVNVLSSQLPTDPPPLEAHTVTKIRRRPCRKVSIVPACKYVEVVFTHGTERSPGSAPTLSVIDPALAATNTWL